MRKIWAKIPVISLLTFGLVIPTATPWGISEANAARPNAINGLYTTYSFANAITGATGNGSEVTFTFNPTAKTGTGNDWRVGDFITVTFPSSNTTTTAYNLGQVAITAITTSNPYTITVASTVKVDTAKYPNTVALTGLTSSSTGIQAGTLAVTRDPSGGSTPNGCSLGGTMTIATGTNYLVPKYSSLGQAINGSGVKIAAGSESLDQGIYGNLYQENKTVNGTVLSALASCKGTLYIPEGVKSLSSSGQSLVTNIAFPSTIDVVQGGALSGYSSLVSLNLDPVKYLMSSAFVSGCNITSLSLGPTFEFFGKSALQGCANLTAVALPASIRSLGEWTFGGSAVTYFDLPAGFTCTEPGLFKETGCDWKIGQYFFGGAPGNSYAITAPQIKINLGNIASASTKLALQHYLGVQTLRGTVTSVNDPNCTVANSCKTTTYVPSVPSTSGNLITDGFGRTAMGYNVGNFPSAVFTQNSAQGPEKTFTQSVSDGVTTQLTALSSMSFSKSNNTFVGWNTAADGSGTAYSDASSINITSTLYLYAQWSPIYTYTVNLNPGTGGTGTQMTAMTGTAATVVVNANTYSRTGYTFSGWNTAENGSGTSYANQGTVRLTVDNQTFTLFAQWSIITYTITYLPGPNGTSISSAQTLNYGGSVTLKDASAGFTRIGYSITGWTTSSVSGAAKTNDLSSAYSSLSSITLYPVWGAGVYVITYDGQGATTAASGGSTTYTANTAITSIPTTAPLRSGYNFVGWFTAATGGTQVTDGSHTPSTPFGAVTIYARWSAITSNAITFDGQGATTAASGGSTTYTTATAIAAIPTTAPLRSGYNFVGWFTAATGGTQVTNGSYTPSTPFGAVTIYARWSAEVYAINFNYGSASSGSPLFSFTTSVVSSTVSRASYSYGDPALTLPTVGSMSRTGYSFAGWMLPNGNVISSPFTPTATTTLTAKWNIQSFSISYTRGTIGSVTVTGSAPVSQSGNYLSTIILASTETTTDIAGQRYDFAGWTISGTRYPIGSSIQLGASNVIATASWVPVYTVTYILSGGVCVSTTCADDPQTDQSGVNLPVAPSRTGYNFVAWKDQSGSTYVAGGTLTVTATSYIMTATWLGIDRTVTYINPNGVGIPTQANRIYQDTFNVGVAPTRTGYDFGGWSDQSTAIYLPGDIYSVGLTNVTLTATWIPLGISLTFFNNDGTSGLSNQSLVADTLTPLTRNTLTRVGYTFTGWNTLANGSGTPYSDLQNISIVSALNLYAQWTANTYTVTYDTNSSTSGTAPASQSYTTAGITLTIDNNSGTLVRTGYTFAGWNTLANGSGTNYASATTGQTFVANTTLYAKWTANTYSITYDSNSATSGTAPTSQSYTTGGSTLTLPGNSGTLVRTGYTYSGWNTAADGSGTSYTATQSAVIITSNVLLYATWLGITYTISYDANGSTTGSVPSSQSYTSGGSTLTLATNSGILLKTGYFFAGWNTLSVGTGTDFAGGAAGQMFTANVILYAKWTITPNSTVTFKANFGSASDVSQSTNVDTNLISNAFTYPGYNFVGWNSLANGTGTDYANNAIYNFASNLTLFAKWTAKATRTLTFSVTTVSINLGDTATATASLSTGSGTVVYSAGSSTACTVDSATGLITITSGVGTCSISASVAEDATYQVTTSTSAFVITVGFNIPAIPIISAVGASANTMLLTVTQTDLTTNGINNYKYSIDGINYISTGNIASPLSISGLTPGIYSVRLKAVNPSGESAPSAALTVIVIAGPSVTVNVPSSAPAPTPGPSAAEIEAANKALLDKIYAEREAAAREAAEKAAAEKAAADKAASEKAAADKAAADKLATDKAASDKAAADKLAADKAAADKLAADKLAADKAAAEKAIAEKLAAEKAASAKIAAEKLAAEKLAAEKLAAERAAAEKLAAEQVLAAKLAAEKAAADILAACVLGKSSTLVTAKKKTMSIYSQVCFVPDLLKPIDKDIAEINKVIQLIKSKKIKSINLLSFADEKTGVDFKSVAQSRADLVAGMIKKSIPNLKITYSLFGSSTKKNIVSQGRVVITSN